jgi:hypothetical protein
MPPTGRRVALVTGGISAAAIGIAAFAARDRIAEEWYIHRLGKGDDEAKIAAIEELGVRGGEMALIALEELRLSNCIPDELTIEDLASARRSPVVAVGPGQAIKIPVTTDEFVVRSRRASGRIQGRLGPGCMASIAGKLLPRNGGSPRLRVLLAREVIAKRPGYDLGPDMVEIAILRLQDCLQSLDPIVKVGAAYGLGEAGHRASDALPALVALRGDPDQRVRVAAECAIRKIRLLAVESEDQNSLPWQNPVGFYQAEPDMT